MKLDPRAQRSREWMISALLELIDEKNYEKISITEITDRAGLSRPTFYLHYKSKDEILIDHLESMLDPIMEEFHQLRRAAEIDQPGHYAATRIFEEIQKHKVLFRTVFFAGAEKLFMRRYYERNLEYLNDLARRCEMKISNEVLELSAQYLAGAFVGLINNWIRSEDPHSPKKMGEFFTEITRSILRTAICNGELDYIFTTPE